MLNKSSEDKQADARLEQVLEAIKKEDKKALKSLFSKKALEEAEDIDSRIEYLFTLIQGEVEIWERDALSSYESIGGGKRSESIQSWYTVTTDTYEYKFFLLDYSVDTINPDNAGLYTLRAIKAEDEKTQFTFWQDMAIAGIYMPEK